MRCAKTPGAGRRVTLGAMVTKGELEITDLNRLYLDREQLGVQIMGFDYGQYLLGLLGEGVF